MNGANDFCIYSQDLSQRIVVGLVIGTYAAMPYVHLHLENLRRQGMGVPVLVHDDASPAGADLQALCRDYSADFRATTKRSPTWIGDLSVFAAGFDWARERGVDVLVKMSRRFIPIYNWVPELDELARRTQYATYSNHTTSANFGFRTECVAMHVPTWEASGGYAAISRQITMGKTPLVESFIHSLAKAAHRASCAANRAYEQAHPKEPRFAGYGDWDILGTDRAEPLCHLLWHHSSSPVEYCRAALQYDISLYSLDEWQEPNAHRPSALYGSPSPSHLSGTAQRSRQGIRIANVTRSSGISPQTAALHIENKKQSKR